MELLLLMEVHHQAMLKDEVRYYEIFPFRIYVFISFLASIAPHKQGSVSGSTGKSKLMRRSSVKLRKPSLRMKESGKRKKHMVLVGTHEVSYSICT